MKQIILLVLCASVFMPSSYAQMEFSLFNYLEAPIASNLYAAQLQLDNSIFFIGRKSIPLDEQVPISFNGWQWVEITGFDGKVFKIEGRYLLSNDIMEIRFEDYYVTLYPSKVKDIQLADRNFIPSLFQKKDAQLYSYFEVLSRGEIAFLKKYNLDYEKQLLKEKFYYKKQDKVAQPMSYSRRKFLKLFGNSSKLMKRYVTENKLNIRSQEDLIKIFNFYNSTSGWATNSEG